MDRFAIIDRDDDGGLARRGGDHEAPADLVPRRGLRRPLPSASEIRSRSKIPHHGIAATLPPQGRDPPVLRGTSSGQMKYRQEEINISRGFAIL